MTNIVDLLLGRSFIEDTTSKEIREITERPIKFYHGIDPTANCLHLGNLVGLVLSRWFQKCGHKPYILIGGGTGMIGDPSGKSTERPLLNKEQIEANVRGIRSVIEKTLDFSNPATTPVFVNNLDWLSEFSVIDFLRDIGKHFRLGPMLAKESVKQRVNSEDGMSFTEFTYQVLQGYDFMHLFQKEGVVLQFGGSDQWGNITAGCELTRKVLGKAVYGLTYPLLTRSDGKKFGKSEQGAIWLDPTLTSYYDFYQYFMQVPDLDVPKLMRMLTFMEMDEINAIEEKLKSGNFIPNEAQRRLAEEMTLFIHGKEGLSSAKEVTSASGFGCEMSLDIEALENIAPDFPQISFKKEDVLQNKYVELCVKSGLLPSKSEAIRLIKNNGAYLNNEKIEDPSFVILDSHLIGGKFLVLGSGKKKKLLVKLSEL
jgi:tyrosyl-tRNA synthetase